MTDIGQPHPDLGIEPLMPGESAEDRYRKHIENAIWWMKKYGSEDSCKSADEMQQLLDKNLPQKKSKDKG